MSNRYAAAALNVGSHNRFAVFEEEEEGAPRLPPAAPVRVPSVRSLPPLPKITPSGGGGGGAAAGSSTDASGASYGDRLRARKAAGAPTTPAAPNLTSRREFPTLGGGGGAGAATTSEVKWSSGTWASKAHAFAEHDAREKEAHALKVRREEIERTNLVGIGAFRIAPRVTGPTVADYEEEDRLRGLLGTNDSYSYDYSYRPAETGSYTPPYSPYDGEGGAPMNGEGGEGGAGDEERW